MYIICVLLTAYLVVLAVRAVLSFFPIRPGTPVAAVFSVVYDLTEPVLAPMRRIIPPAGMIDVSFIVVFFIIVIVRNVICG